MPRPGRFTFGKEPVPIIWEAGWTSGPVWTGAENLAPHWDSILVPSSPLRYPDPRRNIRHSIKYAYLSKPALFGCFTFCAIATAFPSTRRGVVTCVAVAPSCDVMTQGLACHTTLE